MSKTFKPYRLKEEDPYYSLEVKYVKEFEKQFSKDSMVDLIVFGQKEGASMEPSQYLTEREMKIVLSTIQWLGTPVGQGFIEQVQNEK